MREGSAEGYKFSTDVKVTKETLHFQNYGVECIKALKGLQGTLGVRVNDKVIIAVKRNARKGEENST